MSSFLTVTEVLDLVFLRVKPVLEAFGCRVTKGPRPTGRPFSTTEAIVVWAGTSYDPPDGLGGRRQDARHQIEIYLALQASRGAEVVGSLFKEIDNALRGYSIGRPYEPCYFRGVNALDLAAESAYAFYLVQLDIPFRTV